MEGRVKMRLLMIAFTAMALSFFGCAGGEDESAPGAEHRKAETNMRTYKLAYDLAEERKLQEAVDNGGQTWRKNPVDVAHAALINQGANVRIEDCAVVGEEEEDHRMVEVKGADGTYRVHLRRLVRPGGIWTATEIDILDGGNGGSHSGHEGGHGDNKHRTLY